MVKKTGNFIYVPRSIFNDESLDDGRYSRREAFLDLVQRASYEPEKVIIVKGGRVVIKRGQLAFSLRKLSEKWGWGKDKVSKTLNDFKAERRIDILKDSLTSIISIINYDLYQGLADTEADSIADSGADTNKDADKDNIKNNKEEYNTSDTNVSSYSIPKEEKKKEKEEDTGVSSKKDPADYSFIIKSWNETMRRTGKIPRVASISEARKEKIRLRIAEMGGWERAKEIIAECFRKINESEFCNGENDRVWVANIDWFFTNDKNWLKVYEGNYDNRQRKTQLEEYAENVAKANAYYEQRYHGYGGASPYGDQAGSGPYSPDEQ